MIERNKLSQHKFEKGKLITPFNQIFQDLLKNESWYYGRMPEYIWLGLIVNDGDRNVQMEKCLKILNYLHELDEDKEIDLPKISLIFNLPDEKQKDFYKLLQELHVIESLRPLSLVFSEQSPEFSKSIEGHNISIQKRVEILNSILEDLYDQHSNLTTDVRFLVLYKFTLSGKFQVLHDSVFPEMFSRYAFISHENPKMQLYRPTIRSTEMAISTGFNQEDSTNIVFVESFWTKLSLLTDCEVFYVAETTTNEPINLKKYKQHVYNILNYYTKVFTETRPLDNRMFVLLGIATYSYKMLIELVDHNLESTISGRSIMRTITENYMMTKYLLFEEPNHEDIWGEYQDYGIGQYKLIYGRYDEDDKSKIKESHVPFEYMNLLVSEFKNEEFIDIDTSYFGSGNIREKFKKVNEEDLWKYYYDYDSIFAHGLWGAIRESSILKCDAPGHQYHGIPDIDNLQKLSSVAHDCVMIMNKHLKILEDQYNLPDVLRKDNQNE